MANAPHQRMIEQHRHDGRADVAAAHVRRDDDVVDPGALAVGDGAGEGHDASVGVAGRDERRRGDDRRADLVTRDVHEPVEVLQEIEDLLALVVREAALQSEAAIVELGAGPQERRRSELGEAREEERHGLDVAAVAASPEAVDDLAAPVERPSLAELDDRGHAREGQTKGAGGGLVSRGSRGLERSFGLRRHPVGRVVDRRDVLVGTGDDAPAEELPIDAHVQGTTDERRGSRAREEGAALRDPGDGHDRRAGEKRAAFVVGSCRRHREDRRGHGSRMARWWYLEKVQIQDFC